jgi:hypothetical protein
MWLSTLHFFEWKTKEIFGTSCKSRGVVENRDGAGSSATQLVYCAAMSFAIASCFASDDPFGSDVSFTRDPLSMSIGFNILLMGEWPAKFPFWFVAGNVGLFSGLVTLMEKMR